MIEFVEKDGKIEKLIQNNTYPKLNALSNSGVKNIDQLTSSHIIYNNPPFLESVTGDPIINTSNQKSKDSANIDNNYNYKDVIRDEAIISAQSIA